MDSFLHKQRQTDQFIGGYEWNSSSLGNPDQWPISVRTTMSFLLHSTFPIILYWGPEQICFYNDAFARLLMFNNKPQQSIGKKGAELWQEKWTPIERAITKILSGGESIFQKEVLLPVHREEKMTDVFWTCGYSPVFDDNGDRAGVLAVYVEQAENKQLIRQMHDLDEKAKLAIEAGNLGVVEVNLVTEEVFISARIEEIFGLKSGSDRKAFLKQMHPDDLALREGAYQRAYQTGHLEYESRVYKGDNTERWIRLNGTLMLDELKQPQKMLAVVQDITEQKKFSEELQRQVQQRTDDLRHAHESLILSHTYLQDIINIYNAPLQVLQPVIKNGDVVDFIYKLTNEAYAAYANKKPAELTGRKVSEIFPGYFNTDSFRNIREVAVTGIPKLWENHYAADGYNIYNEMGAVKMDEDVVVHLNDFTKLKQLQLQLVGNIAELERSNQNLEEFAHAASHDLKEPIRKIKFFTAQLKEQLGAKLSESQRRSFERIENASERMGNLVDDLLLYSHVSQRPQQMEAIDLSAKIKQVMDDLEIDIKEKQVSLHVGVLPTVTGHRRQLQQLFQNLISNAIKYSKPGVQPMIRIDSSIEVVDNKTYHLITVRDNGIGFNEIYSDQIFQMFTRLHTKSEYTGTGVGLSIAKKVVENHNGLIRVKSTPGEGSTFMVYLPVEQPESGVDGFS